MRIARPALLLGGALALLTTSALAEEGKARRPLGIGEVLISGYLGDYKEIFFFGAMVLILILKPSGLLGGSREH